MYKRQLLRIPLNGNFIAALLTILGYSINDTVVIYDRIRENSALYGKKQMSLAELVNLSVNQSFARSLMTSITTCLALGVVCVVSVIYRLDSIYSFAFPLLFGMVSGVYSTICIATPLWVDWKNKKKAAKKALKEGPQKEFVKRLASYADCYINDAFGTAHRAHASTALIADYFPNDKMFGYVMENELKAIDGIMLNPERPFCAILGGSKVSTKITIIENLLEKVDVLVLGGGMTYTFAAAEGGKVGNSICEPDQFQTCLLYTSPSPRDTR